VTAVSFVKAENNGLGPRPGNIVVVVPFHRLKDYVVRSVNQNRRPVTTDLKFGKAPTGILVSRALDVSERGLIGGNVAMDIERYLNFAFNSAPRLSISTGVHTYTSRPRVFDASPPALQS